MKIAEFIATIIDLIISQSLLLVGIYVFFVKQDFVNGAIIIGSHSLYQIPSLLIRSNK